MVDLNGFGIFWFSQCAHWLAAVQRTVAYHCSNPLCVNTIPKQKPSRWDGFCFGGLEGIRTLDPHNANVVRSQLRYKPKYDFVNVAQGGGT